MATKQYNVRMFFYERGSKDYPLNHGIDERFGFDTGSEITGMFKYTMKDIYTNVNQTRVIENINKLNELTFAGNDSPEIISVIVTDPGKPPELPLDPTAEEQINYEAEVVKYNELQKLIESINANEASGVNAAQDERHHLFWRKMFILFELLKKWETSIVSGDRYHPSISDSPFTDPNPGKMLGTDLDVLNSYSTNFAKWLSLIVGSGAGYKGLTSAQQESGSYIRNYDYALEDDKQWYDPQNGDSDNIAIKNTDVSIMSPSDLYSTRIEKMTFTVYANLPTLLPGSTETLPPDTPEFSEYIFNFSLFFVPDTYVLDEYNSNYTVYTYNDDMEEKFTTEGLDRSKYNIYDNDYANALLDKTDPDHGKFIVSDGEFNDLIVKDLTDITTSGIYTGYKIFTTTRVSPEIVDGKVLWDPVNHSIIQKFYVFHTNPDTTEEIPNSVLQDQVRRYLINLHSNCKPQSYDVDGNVTYIGHNVENVQDITAFLANMYPNLFETTNIAIIPSSYMILTQPTAQDKLVPSNYRHPMTASDVDSIVKLVYPQYNLTANVDTDTSSQAGYIEIFSLGLSNTQGDPSVDKPVFQLVSYISRTSGTTTRPITGIKGFETYRPKFFTEPPVDSSVDDIFQYILMKLYMNAFVEVAEGEFKSYYSTILGVPVKYSIDPNYNNGASSTGSRYNLAEVILNNINYSIYCIKDLNFGDPKGNPIAE